MHTTSNLGAVFSGQLFKVTPSFHDWRYIEVIRPVAETDFDFEISLHESPFKEATVVGHQSFAVGFRTKAIMKPDILAEIRTVFKGVDNHDVYVYDDCQKLCSGTLLHHDSFVSDFRGCRNEAGCKAKYDRTLPLLREKAMAGANAGRELLVAKINGLIKGLIDKENRHYEDQVFRTLISSESWPNLLEQADVTEQHRLLQEALQKVDSLSQEIKDILNQFALKAMEEAEWKVNGVPLVPAVVERLKEAYQEGFAFDSGRILIHK